MIAVILLLSEKTVCQLLSQLWPPPEPLLRDIEVLADHFGPIPADPSRMDPVAHQDAGRITTPNFTTRLTL